METVIPLRLRHGHAQDRVVRQLRPVPIDDVGEVVGRESVAGDARLVRRADHVGAQVQRRQAREALGRVDGLDVDVDEFQTRAGHLRRAVDRGCDVEVRGSGDVFPGYVGDLELQFS